MVDPVLETVGQSTVEVSTSGNPSFVLSMANIGNQGLRGVQGIQGATGSNNLSGQPIAITGSASGDTISFNGSVWENSKAEIIADGGDF